MVNRKKLDHKVRALKTTQRSLDEMEDLKIAHARLVKANSKMISPSELRKRLHIED